MAFEENTPQDEQSGGSVTAPAARPSTLFTPKVKIGIVFALVAVGLAYFAWSAFASATVNYSRVDEVAVAGPTPNGSTVGVIGKLVQDSYVRAADGVTATFKVVDDGGAQQMAVNYKGEIGQVFFNQHSQIILQGRMGPDDVFHADTMTVRCPSKYQTESDQGVIQEQNNGTPVAPPYQPDYFDNHA